MKGSGLGVSREHQVSQQSGFLVRQGSANSLAGLSKVRGTGSSFRAPTMKAALHQRTSTDEFGYWTHHNFGLWDRRAIWTRIRGPAYISRKL